MATTSPETMLVCTCALLTGLLYEKDLLGVQSWLLFPERLINFGSEFIGPILETPPPAHLNKPLGATLELQEQAEWDRREFQHFEARRAVMQNLATNSFRFQT
ncbi:unnamed protein product [Echinostoma caproni]|uniref:Uncharacterized protein n=1 Tax=Echinostoma caproni TaxID=27848 RepID=A0A183A0Y4_9TREM|nr:unnamed protein product [Echinostoma caproni]